jgi:hypothetical protein
LNSKTSMNIGVVGDFYINFGFSGTILAMFVFGRIISRILRWFFRRYVSKNPINIIWIPFIFTYLIRPGNEFYIIINHLIKALIILYFFNKIIVPYFINNLKKNS